MNLLVIALVLSWLVPNPAGGQDVGTVTLLEGPLVIVRGTTVLQAAEGTRLRQGDMIESSDKGYVQLEFGGGAIVALGPSSRMYVFREGAGGKTGSETGGAELVLLSGWLKGESNAHGSSYRYECPLLAATTANATLVFHSVKGECDIFIESGSAAISEVNSAGNAGKPTAGSAGQFFSRHQGKNLVNASHPSAAVIDSMPRPFRDALPSRLAHFSGKPAEPKVLHQVSYAEIQDWLSMPPAWRRGFAERFEPRLKDPEFRKQVEMHAGEYPEWEAVLHPK